MPLNIGIDASRNRSGGALAHLIGLIEEGTPARFGIEKVHVWSYASLLDRLPNHQWLVIHRPPMIEKNILFQLFWQRFLFPKELRASGCDILLNTDAGTVGKFRPCVTMSRDMLSYEPGEIERYPIGKKRLRLWLLRFIQNRSLRFSDGVIFLTKYAAEVIQGISGKLNNTVIIPHGVHERFKAGSYSIPTQDALSRKINCLYVSNVAPYKHQWHVVHAISKLRKQGYPIYLTLVGGGDKSSLLLLDRAIHSTFESENFVNFHPFVENATLPLFLADADIFIFASSCENMPNTLIEAMAFGLPICSSKRGPMPEILRDGGLYFDPENPESIAASIRTIVDSLELRKVLSQRSKAYSEEFSWKRTSELTFSFLVETFMNRKPQ